MPADTTDISTELPCLGDLKNPGRLPVQQVLVIVSCRFLKFYHYLCFEVRESFADIPTELPCLGDLKIQVTFRFKRFSRLPKHLFLDKNALNL